jgi:aspartyl/glutamyl-tRNA(Asn/Gln) amidotransferase C subunit
MISREEIQNLAELSRLKLTDEEIATLRKDFDSILEYVGQISAVTEEGQA